MKPKGKRFIIVCILLALTAASMHGNEREPLDRTVHISKNKETIYSLLKDISAQSGYLFIYDSQIIDNDRKVKIARGQYTLRSAIRTITGNNDLQIDVSGEYILLRAAEAPAEDEGTKATHITVGGTLSDQDTQKPIAFASVSISNASIGTITNRDGEFQLTVPDSLRGAKVKFSHIGYESRETNLELLESRYISLTMVPHVIPLQEVVVQAVNPEQVLSDMLSSRAANYAEKPVQMTTFYREGIDHDSRNIDLTESVLQVYKTGHRSSAAEDQVKLIKKRRVLSRSVADTIFPKMRSGINSCLILDIIKELPEFIDPGGEATYKYSHTGRSTIDGRAVNIITFKQSEHIKEAMYTGKLFVETESKALAEVRFEINPDLVGKATHMFVDKKSTGLKITLQQAQYIVSYKLSSDGKYYINHIHGDIRFKVRRRKQLFSSPLRFWFEMVTCKVDTDARPIPMRERLSTTRIFAETKHEYDKHFWQNFNIILPEEELKETIIRNLNSVSLTEQ